MKRSRLLLALCVSLVMLGGRSAALDPALGIAQYKSTVWGIEEGAPRSIRRIVHGRDGYLWLGSATGLFRFDGSTFELIPSPTPQPASPSIGALLAAHNGEIWVGYDSGAIAVLRGGALRAVPIDSSSPIMALAQMQSGELWAAIGRNQKPLAHLVKGKWIGVGADWGLPEGQPWNLLAARSGSLWLSQRNYIFVLKPQMRRFERVLETISPSALSEDGAGNIWISNQQGSRAIADRAGNRMTNSSRFYPTPSAKRGKRTIFDRDGNLWGLSDYGVYRLKSPTPFGPASATVAAAAVTQFDTRSGFAKTIPAGLAEDREGDLWVSSGPSLMRLRPTNVVADPILTNTAKWGDPLLSATDGAIYVGEADGVYRILAGGSPTMFLRGSEPQALCEGLDGTIWTVLQDRVVGVRRGKATVLPGPGKTDMGISDCAVDSAGGLWLAGLLDGALHWSHGTWDRKLVPRPTGGLPPSAMIRTRDRRLLVSFSQGGVGVVSPEGTVKMVIARDHPMGMVRTMYDGREGVLLGGVFGLALLKNGRLHILSSDRTPALLNVSGIAQTPDGDIWLRVAAGIVWVAGTDLRRAVADSTYKLSPMVLDFRDGLAGTASSDAVRDAVRGGDGRIWFGSTGGVVSVDPARLTRNMLPPPVSISALRANDKMYHDPHRLRLAPGSSSISISFAALSLPVPGRVQVRYRLEGEDANWVDPGARRQAFYTNLRPGDYTFQVVAANNDGVWNRTGASLRFTIPPTFLQSSAFLVLCILAGGLLLWWLYILRLRHLTAKMGARLEERERIARDLHDTLLQGFQGLLLRFQSVANEIPDQLKARRLIEEALDSADDVLAEGRNSVAQLRSDGAPDLPQALMTTAERMREDYRMEFKMTVEGAPRVLHPVAREELRRIGDEAIINAFQHSRATVIEIVISYHRAALLMGVRDDGIGIASEITADSTRQGHFGLVGMRERAGQISAEFKISTRVASGTEVHVRVPARIAYEKRRRNFWGQWLRHQLHRRDNF